MHLTSSVLSQHVDLAYISVFFLVLIIRAPGTKDKGRTLKIDELPHHEHLHGEKVEATVKVTVRVRGAFAPPRRL